MILLIGKRGMLSGAIQDLFRSENLVIVENELARQWSYPNSRDQIIDFMKALKQKPSLIINSAGNTNPLSQPELLLSANLHLPKNLYEFAEQNQIKLVTFGTIFENFVDIAHTNAYLKSKYEFYKYIKDKSHTQSHFLHLQAHTWYGGHVLHRHMFLGQAFNSIKKEITFNMTSGEQLREFHHIKDDMGALELLLRRNIGGIFQLNHGLPVTLRALAEHLFSNFGISDKLKVGSLPNPKIENSKVKFVKNELLNDTNFRDTYSGVSSYFESLLKDSQ